MSLNKEQVCVIGDDLSTDILGANNVECRSVLLASGKCNSEHLSEDYPRPTVHLNSIVELPALLGA